MNYIVQKYGGTSLGKADRMLNVASIIQNSLKKNRVVAVVSAMSSYVKTEGTTSRLIEAGKAALEKGVYYKIVDILEESHISTVNEAIQDKAIKEALKDEIKNELKHLKSFLEAIQVIGEISSRSEDVIVGVGEKLSARILAGVLNDQGIDAEYVNLDQLIDRDFAELNQDFYDYLKTRLANIVEELGNKVPVVTGFFGFVPNGIINSIGRGYTDFTAALIAAGMNAQELQIWKEVDGIFSADPRKVGTAKVLDHIAPEEAAELTYYGSEVIHPFTMEQVMRVKIPIRIKNTFNPKLQGTLIDPNSKEPSRRTGTAVTVKRNVIVLNVHSNRMLMAHGFMAKVFNTLDKYGIIIDLISTSEVNLSMTIEKDKHLEDACKDLEKFSDIYIEKGMAILSLVGRGMKHNVGIAGQFFATLGQEEINIEMISQGSSEINISCVISGDDADHALVAIHDALLI
ncbi:MAG: aspartate kinase [bacterium]|jgi:aspartate kinase